MPEGGPLTLVVSAYELLVDRLCDLDGDGSADNSIANLGAADSQLFAMMVTARCVDSGHGGGDQNGVDEMRLVQVRTTDEPRPRTATESSVK